MHVPPPLPDELAYGYMGRILRLNGYSEWRMFIKQYGEKKQGKEIPRLSALAMFARMDVEDFVFHHTLMPFFWGVRGSPSANVSAEKGQSWTSLLKPSRSFTNAATYLCPSCVEEDLDFWGFSYWRRVHQLPGMTLCPKHDSALHEVREKDAHLCLPHEVLPASVPIHEAIAAHVKSNAVILRYREMCSLLLDLHTPLPQTVVKAFLTSVAINQGFKTSGVGNSRVVSDQVLEQTSGPWLAEYFPLLKFKIAGSYSHPFDHVWKHTAAAATTFPVEGFALTMACLFEDAEAAMHALQVFVGDAGRQVQGNNDEPVLLAVSAFLQGSSLMEVCSQYRVTLPMLESLLRKMGKIGFPQIARTG